MLKGTWKKLKKKRRNKEKAQTVDLGHVCISVSQFPLWAVSFLLANLTMAFAKLLLFWTNIHLTLYESGQSYRKRVKPYRTQFRFFSLRRPVFSIHILVRFGWFKCWLRWFSSRAAASACMCEERKVVNQSINLKGGIRFIDDHGNSHYYQI